MSNFLSFNLELQKGKALSEFGTQLIEKQKVRFHTVLVKSNFLIMLKKLHNLKVQEQYKNSTKN